MERKAKGLFTEDTLRSGARCFGIQEDKVSLIGGYQNFIYEYKRQDKCYILRFTNSSHRSEDSIKGEVDFVMYLAKKGLSVSSPILSEKNRLTEKIQAEDYYFTATSFEKAEGEKIGYPNCLRDDRLFEECGRLTGRLHAFSKMYKPDSQNIRRHEWIDNYYLKNINRFIPEKEQEILKGCHKLIKDLNELKRDEDSYGLIHGDINVSNFLVKEGLITLFDFDESQYSWYVEDIAIQLFYMIYVFGEDSRYEREEVAKRFMINFMGGYEEENHIDEYYLKQIPLFLRLREIIVYIGMRRNNELNNLSQWQSDYLRESRQRIEQGISLISNLSL